MMMYAISNNNHHYTKLNTPFRRAIDYCYTLIAMTMWILWLLLSLTHIHTLNHSEIGWYIESERKMIHTIVGSKCHTIADLSTVSEWCEG